MTKFFFKFKKPYFWAISGPFPQFWGKKKFSKKSDSATHNFIRVSSTIPKFCLTKNYCIIVSMQKISSFHNLILKIQQTLGSHELNDHTHFDHTHPNIEITFSFPNFAPTCQKSIHSHLFTLVIQSILESCDQTGHTHF